MPELKQDIPLYSPQYHWVVFPKALDPSPILFFARDEEDLLRQLRDNPDPRVPGWIKFFNVQDALDALRVRARWDEFISAATRV